VGDSAGGRKDLVLGPGKNGGYHRAGRVGVSTGGRLRWGRINISAKYSYDPHGRYSYLLVLTMTLKSIQDPTT
jgi:hypothetical protein